VALRRARGFNLPELMISLAIGSLLLAAFLSILDRARREFTAN
jgi:prepilin-type N-terminal cleavage/methylation domain-containing protein